MLNDGLAMFLSPLFTILAVVAAGIIASPAANSVPSGFVTTKGTQFELDGKPFVSRQPVRPSNTLTIY